MILTQNINSLQGLNFLKGSSFRIGVLGGTFEPAHEGHLKLSIQALNFYKFDYIIWLVANQNPLKPKCKKDIFQRAEVALEIAQHPRIIVATAEYDLGCYYIYDSLKALINKYARSKFTWLMGMDSVASFRKWHRHKQIPELCDIVVFDRPCPTRLVNINSFGLNAKGSLDKTQTNHIMINRKSLYDISSTQIRETVKENTV